MLNIKIKLLILLSLIFVNVSAQKETILKGRVLDKTSKEPLPAAIIKFRNSNVGTVANLDGYFNLSNKSRLTEVEIGLIGYETLTMSIPADTTTIKQIFLDPKDINLNEVVIKSNNQKYIKKDNPAVELIKKVIENKDQNSAQKLKDYSYNEFERYIFAFNEFDPESRQFRKYKFLKNYADTSLIDSTPILPISVKDKITDVFTRNSPHTEKRIIKGQRIEGIDQYMDQESIEGFIKEAVQTVDITDNYITLLFNNFVSPLSSTQSTNFYKWYIIDTVSVNNQKIVQLDFGPFNSADLGFTGSLFVNLDDNYALNKVVLNTPKKINLNWVTDLRLEINYNKTDESVIWYPQSTRIGMNLNVMHAIKAYIEKSVIVDDFVANQPMDPIYAWKEPVIFEKDYNKKDKEFWINNTPDNVKKDMKMDKLMEEIRNIFLVKVILNVGSVLSTGYIPLSSDPEKNKFELGNVGTFVSYNTVEGLRVKGGIATTRNFNKNLYLYGHGAYGIKDKQFKYMGEATWRFNNAKTHKEEYPVNNLSFSYQYDMIALGQTFTQAERDNFLMSWASTKDIKLTYGRVYDLKYVKEYYNGFSFTLNLNRSKQTPAGNLVFEKFDTNNDLLRVSSLSNTVGAVTLRYAYNEKFMQRRRMRLAIPSESFITKLTYEKGLKNVLGGEFDYDKLSLSASKEFWVTPYGKISVSGKAEKLWGKAPYPMLISPSANSSLTVQNQTFYLINPLEFIHDEQVSWEVYYRTGGFILNRIPILKKLKWRELVGFRGFYGRLSDKNNPRKNQEMLLFPDNAFQTVDNVPYMEYNIGIENIFNLFRIDYVRRINYKYHPNINKSGIRVSFQVEF